MFMIMAAMAVANKTGKKLTSMLNGTINGTTCGDQWMVPHRKRKDNNNNRKQKTIVQGFFIFTTWGFTLDLLGGDLERSVADRVNHIVSGLSVNSASNRLGSAENLLDCSLKLLRHGPGAHDAGNAVDLINGDVSVVLDFSLRNKKRRRKKRRKKKER